MKTRLLLLLLLLLTGGARAQTLLKQESFETDGEGTRYTTNTFDYRSASVAPDGTATGFTRYWTRNCANPVLNPYPAGQSTSPPNASFGANAFPITIGNTTGSCFWIGESVRGINATAGSDTQPAAYVELTPTNTTGYTGLQVRVDLAQGTRVPPNNGVLQIENDDFIRIEYTFDPITNPSPAWVVIGQFVGDNAAAATAGNWRQDVGRDGSSADDVALGSPILSQTLTTYTFPITPTGSALRVRVVLDERGGNEELAFDNIRILGTLSATSPPVLGSIESSVLPYSEGQAATQVTSALTVSDADSPTLAGATVQFVSGFVSGQDVLAFTAGNGISGTYTSTTGVLALSGTASLASYQAALRSVTYRNSNVVTAIGGNRVVQFTATDGTNSSNAVSRTIAVTAVLNGPVALPYAEDFTTDGEGLRYNSNQFAPGPNAGFLRTNANPYDAAGSPTTFTNISNGYYWFGENTTIASNPDPLRIGRLTTQQVDATNYTNLQFQIRLGATSVGSRIQNTDYFKLYYRAGGSAGTWTLFGSFRGTSTGGSGVMKQDADPNNPGTFPTGTTLTEALQNFTFALPAALNGQLVDFRLDLSIDDDPADFAFDLLQVTGTLSPPVVTAPANGSLLNTRTPAYSGTAPAGSTVTVIVDGSSIGTTTATAGGTFSLTQPTSLADGSHTVRATATLNGVPSASSNTNTFTVDATAPTVTISSTAGASGSTTSTSPIPFTVTFSESVTGFIAGDVAVTNGTLSGFSGSGTTYTFTVTPAANGPVTVSVLANVAQDAAGNGNTAAPLFSITYTQPVTAAPVVTTPANGSLLNTATPTYSGTAPAGSTVTVIVDGSSIGTTTATAGGTFSLTQPTALADGSHTVRATAQTSGAAVSPSSGTNTFTVDTVSPTGVISSTAGASGSTTSTSPIPFTVTFSESVTGFVASDVAVTNGTLSGFSGSGSTYTFNITPAANGPVTVSVPANAAQDAAGNGNTAAPLFSITYTLPVTLTTWTGAASTDWFTASNWTAGVPTSTLDARISVVGTGRYPLISAGTAATRSLTVNTGTTLTQTGGTLDVRADLTNNGIFTLTGGTVVLGTAPQSNGPNILGSSSIRFWNLTVNNNGVLLSTSAGASVQRLLTLNGAFVTQSNVFTLESSSAGTAMVVNNSGGFVFGTATVQRYIDPSLNAGLGYRHYSSPVVSTTVADLSTSTFTPVVNPAYNTVGNTVTPFPTVYGYDESRVTATNATTQSFDQGFFSPDTTTSRLTPGRGYTVNIDAASKVDLVGALNNGTISVGALSRGSTANAGWHLLGNPYPAPLDWSVARTGLPAGVIDAVYVFKSSSQYAGTYQFYQNGFGTLPGGLIGSMQGFFVRVSQPVASFSFLNAWRSTTYQNPAFNRPTADLRPAVQLELVDARGTRDAAFVYFEQGATAGLDDHYDAVKLPNTTGLNLASVAVGSNLAVNGLPPMGSASVTVPLFIGLPATGTYALHAAQLLNFAPGAQPWLRDLQLNTLTDLSLTPDYTFTMNAANTTPRFELVFGPAQVLSTSAALAAQVAVYPNPARTAVAVELPGSLSRQPVTAALVDALGRVVQQQVLPAGLSTHRLPLSNVATGVYSLRLSTPSGIIVKKLIVE
ncbi:T9SS type A sorting domain-containing protein [Hymenobacter daeguensis]